jgi:hypothetical protein
VIHCPYNFGIYKKEYNLIICHPKGELTSDMMNDIAICRECIQKAGLFQTNRFHNLTDITAINLRFNEVHQICVAESNLRDST